MSHSCKTLCFEYDTEDVLRPMIFATLVLALVGCYSPCTSVTRVPRDAYSSSLTVTTDGKDAVAAAVSVRCTDSTITALTAAHVMHGGEAERYVGRQRLSTAKLHPKADLALVTAPRGNEPCTAACIGEPATVGDHVWVVGSALGQPRTVSAGVAVAVLEDNLDGKKFMVYRTDATVLPGNSGGGMFNADGCLVGIVSFVYMPLPLVPVTGTGSAVHTVHLRELLKGVL